MTFEFALLIEPNQNLLSRVAKEYLILLISYNKMPYNAMKLNDTQNTMPYSFSLLKEVAPDTTLSVLKKAQDSNALIYHVFNTNNKVVSLSLSTNLIIKGISNLNEEIIDCDKILIKNQVKSIILGVK